MGWPSASSATISPSSSAAPARRAPHRDSACTSSGNCAVLSLPSRDAIATSARFVRARGVTGDQRADAVVLQLVDEVRIGQRRVRLRRQHRLHRRHRRATWRRRPPGNRPPARRGSRSAPTDRRRSPARIALGAATSRAAERLRLGVLDDADDAPVGADEDHVQRDQRVLHPEHVRDVATRRRTASPRRGRGARGTSGRAPAPAGVIASSTLNGTLRSPVSTVTVGVRVRTVLHAEPAPPSASGL